MLASIPKDHDKPVVITVLGDDGPISEDFVKEVRAAGIPFFRSPERALRALAKATRYGQSQRQGDAAPISPAATAALADDCVIPEYRAKALFKAAGVSAPDGALATSLDEAKAAAAKMGYPVVLKAQSAALSHKSDAGGVALNLKDEAALTAAWQTMHERIKAGKGITLDGVLVERMGPTGLEMILGAKRDPSWGAIIMVGLGGIWTELLQDVVLMPTDLTTDEILAKLRSLRVARVFDGYRGQGPLDIAALADAIAILSRFVAANPNVTEIDINPLIAFEAGKGVLALDALIVTGSPGKARDSDDRRSARA